MCHFYNPYSPGKIFGGAYLAQSLKDGFTVVKHKNLRDSQD